MRREDDAFRPRLGAFGQFGGRYASELLYPALFELAEAFRAVRDDADFQREFDQELTTWAGRPMPLTPAPRLSRASGLEVWLKREDLLHGGAHKTNNVVGQALLARRLGKKRLIAETGAGQHGCATAMAAARYGFEAEIYMGSRDMERQRPNVELMRLLGAKVVPVDVGRATLDQAINEALRDWTNSLASTHYLLGTVCGPDPFPSLVRWLQEVIGREARAQMLAARGRLPSAIVACVGGGSNAIGIFSAFLDDAVRLFGVEAGGRSLASGRHGATLNGGRPGLIHGARTYVLQDGDGQILESESVAAGLDYPGVGPEHAFLKETGRVTYEPVADDEAVHAFERLARLEGIVPALESAHAVAWVLTAIERGRLAAGDLVIINLSGRGQKDLDAYFKRRWS